MSKVLRWLDNFWYHYKWTVIVVTFFLIVGIILSVQLFTRPKYDAYIMYVGNEAIPDTQYQDIMDSFKKVAKDYDGNKEIILNFSKTNFIPDPNHDLAGSVNSVATEFLANMSVQPYYIYLMTPVAYELYKDSDVFVPITELFKDLPSDLLYDENAVKFSKTAFSQTLPGVDDLGDDTLLLIKRVPYASSKNVQKKEKAAFENHLDMLTSILHYPNP